MSKLRILSCSAISEFNFFADGVIYRGAVTSDGLYKLIAEYSSGEQAKACALACALGDLGHHSIVSVEWDGVQKVWAEVRSLIDPVPLMRLNMLSSCYAT
ncbi:MAG: hypothetical protein ACTS2F_21120 [Thainema sp.]